jgi:ERCC4-type nuclease
MLADDREVMQHPDIPELLKPVPVQVERLDTADFCFLSIDGTPVGIERAEIGNLLQKLRDGELERQMTKCAEAYQVVYLLTEGVYDQHSGLLAVYKKFSKGYFRNHIYPTTRLEYVIGAQVGLDGMGIRLVSTANFECSMLMVKAIYGYHNRPEHKLFTGLRPIRIPVKMSANPAVPRLLSLCTRMPEAVAIALIGKYQNIWTILNTSDKELLQVKGFGKTLLTRLRESVGCSS